MTTSKSAFALALSLSLSVSAFPAGALAQSLAPLPAPDAPLEAPVVAVPGVDAAAPGVSGELAAPSDLAQLPLGTLERPRTLAELAPSSPNESRALDATTLGETRRAPALRPSGALDSLRALAERRTPVDDLAAPLLAAPEQKVRKAPSEARPSAALRRALLAGAWVMLLGAAVAGDSRLRPAPGIPIADPETDAPSDTSLLDSLTTFHPSWVTRSVTSHDQSGDNDDGHGNGIEKEGPYRVLFSDKGEGRILRLWMTVPNENIDSDYQELWIQADGKTVFRGKPLDLFEGRGPWKAPLVLDLEAASGGFLSYAPFPYKQDAKILFLGDPHYFQVTYRQGEGSSAGPSAEQLQGFLSEKWWNRSPFPARSGQAELDKPLVVAEGPATVAQLSLKIGPGDAARLKLRIGEQAPVPLAFFFGGWAPVKSAVDFVDPETGQLASRLPIPLRDGEKLTIETDGTPAKIAFGTELKAASAPGVRLEAQYREQDAPGLETTMPFFESREATQFVSLSEEITNGRSGPPFYLEGDEMIRTDQLTYPFQLGTGTEDYFNSGWYFHGSHSNPLSGAPLIETLGKEGDDQSRSRHTLYRHHLLDPVVGRSGIRFGFEAGDRGEDAPVRYRTLGLAYVFSGPTVLSRETIPVASIGSDNPQAKPVPERVVDSAVDAEHSQTPFRFRSRYLQGRSILTIPCPKGANALLLVRAYDAGVGDQLAAVKVNDRPAGQLYEAYANPRRRFAEDSIWLVLKPEDAARGSVRIEIDSSKSPHPWSEAGYGAVFYYTGAPSDAANLPPPLFESSKK